VLTVWMLFIFCTVCLYTDVAERKIYNGVILCGILAALGINIMQNGFITGFLFTATGLLTGIFLLIVPFIMGGLGAGDVKMLGMIGAFTGHLLVVQVLMVSAVVGGIFALAVMITNRNLLQRLWALLKGCALFVLTGNTVYFTGIHERNAQKNAIPYGAALSVGVIIIYIMGSMNYALPGFSMPLF